MLSLKGLSFLVKICVLNSPFFLWASYKTISQLFIILALIFEPHLFLYYPFRAEVKSAE